jgi:predicted dehydrogenase
MVNVCLIGCGGVGKRHLEALLKVKNSINVEVVEPNIEKIKESKQINNKFNNYFFDVNDISNDIYICIVATPANVRKSVIKKLIENKNVKYLILEKVVFQNVEDFKEILKLLSVKNIKAYVNCNLRTQPIYKKIKNMLNLNKKAIFTYNHSRDFNLASSSIHILDLFSYLCGDNKLEIKSFLSNNIKKSKHNGCVEFNGSLVATSKNGHKLYVYSGDRDSAEFLNVHQDDKIIISSDGLANLDVRIGKIQMLSKNKCVEMDIPYIWQSSLTNTYVENIIENKKCDLPTLSELSETHISMLNNFNNHLSDVYGEEIINCPIT